MLLVFPGEFSFHVTFSVLPLPHTKCFNRADPRRDQSCHLPFPVSTAVPLPRHPGGMLRLTPRGWVTRGGLQGPRGRWRECANPGHALPSPSRAPSAARSRPAPHALPCPGGSVPMEPRGQCPHGAAPPRGPRAHRCSPSPLERCSRVTGNPTAWLPPAVGKKIPGTGQELRSEGAASPRSSAGGKEKDERSSWKGENAGEWSSVIEEVSSSCEKRGKKAGKNPACGFGDIRKVTLGMDVH